MALGYSYQDPVDDGSDLQKEEAFVSVACTAAVQACCVEGRDAFRPALVSTLTSRYFLANAVYVGYAFLIVYVDTVLQPNADDTKGAKNKLAAYGLVYDAYKVAAIIHVVNAVQYAWSWFPMYTWFSPILIPEYLNVIGSGLYLYTAYLYPNTYSEEIDGPTTMKVHLFETAAAVVELAAAFGWFATWWATFPRGKVNRGWTLDDPDLWGNLFIVLPSALYLTYNIQILNDPPSYAENKLYVSGNTVYALGSIAYLVTSLRDDGWVYFFPSAGTCAYGYDAITPSAPPPPKAWRQTGWCELVGCPPWSSWSLRNCLGCRSSARARQAAAADIKVGAPKATVTTRLL
jgi:hypothetical protein